MKMGTFQQNKLSMTLFMDEKHEQSVAEVGKKVGIWGIPHKLGVQGGLQDYFFVWGGGWGGGR